MSDRFAIAKGKVLDDLEALAMQLYNADGRDMRRSQCGLVNPFRLGAKASQMSVKLKGPKRGAFIDFVSGEKGDALDFVAYALEGAITRESRMRAVEWIEDRYGLRQMDPRDRERIAAEGRAKRVALEAQAERDLAERRERARKMFYSAAPMQPGDAAWRYLTSRGVAPDKVPGLARRTFRFRPDFEYWMDAAKPRLPAMVSAMVDRGGRLCACHITFLKPDGSGKAAVEKAKLMWPETAGLVIRCTQGASGLGAEEAAAAGISGTVALTEGIEDALSVAMADAKPRVWAAGSLSGYAGVPDHGCADGWMVFQDNDWGKPQARRQFDEAVRRLKGFQKPVAVIRMPDHLGKDVNDAIRT